MTFLYMFILDLFSSVEITKTMKIKLLIITPVLCLEAKIIVNYN